MENSERKGRILLQVIRVVIVLVFGAFSAFVAEQMVYIEGTSWICIFGFVAGVCALIAVSALLLFFKNLFRLA